MLFGRRARWTLLVLFAVQAALLGGIVQALRSPAPHDVPVAVVAPAVVGQALAREATQFSGRPFEVSVPPDAKSARADLRAGRVDGVLLLDLARTRDELLLPETLDHRLAEAISTRLSAVEASRGRTVEVTTVPSDAPSTERLRWINLLAGVVGFGFIVVVALRRGVVSRSFTTGTTRTLVLTATGLATGALIATTLLGREGIDILTVGAVLALSTATAGLLTQMLGMLFGLTGLGLAAVGLAGLALPQLTQTDVRLLHPIGQWMFGRSTPGASLDALRAVTQYDAGWARPVLILAGWALAAILVNIAVRVRATKRPQEGVASRARVGLAVVPVLAVTAAIAPLVGSDELPTQAPLASLASETECVGTGTITSVADLNRIASLKGKRAFLGADVGAGARLQDGRRLWLFGDTLRSEDFDGQQFVRNSMMVWGPGCLQVVLPANHGALIPDRRSRGGLAPVGHWPMSVAVEKRPGYDLVAVATQRVQTRGKDAFDFANLGPTIAVFVVQRGQTPQLIDTVDIGPDSDDITRPTWGAASAVHDGWLYLYGSSRSTQHPTYGFSVRVARVRAEQVLQPRQWRYWDGHGWSEKAGDAVELIGGEGGTSQTLSVFSQGGRWYALSKRNEFVGDELTVWTAPTPWGPFDSGTKVADLPSDLRAGELRYMPLAQPDLLPKPGTVVVSFSRNNTDIDKVIADPLLYRPKFMRVDLPR